jgi:hypothetical protein
VSGRLRTLARGLARFAAMAGGVAIGVSLFALALGALVGSSVGRSLTVAFYLAGSMLIVVGFFYGNRGPARPSPKVVGLFDRRGLRWARPEEREETLSASALFVLLGFVLIGLGVLVDSRYQLS